MARLPYVDPASAPPPVREALQVLPPLKIFRTAAHAETALRPLLRLGGALLGAGALDARLRELAILWVAAVTGAEYEWVQHAAIARGVGASEDEVAALERGDIEADCFGADERLVLRLTSELLEHDGAGEVTFAAARERFSSRELVELILTAGYYRMLAGLMNSVAIDLDEPLGMDVVESARRRGH